MNTSTTRFSCPNCGKTFPWKDELAGKQVRCTCGNVFAAALQYLAQRKPEDIKEAPEAFDLYTDAPAPAMRTTRAPQAEFDDTEQPAAPAKPTAFSNYPTRKSRRVEPEPVEETGPSPWKDLYAPIILVVCGLVGWIVLGVVFPMPNFSPAKTLVAGGVTVLTNIVILFMAIFVAAFLLSVNFGSPKSATFKLLGMSLFVSALFLGCVRLDYPDIRGAIVGLHAVVFCYWILFANLFELEMQETLITVAIIGLLQAMAGCVLLSR
jgi:hypothetical protein